MSTNLDTRNVIVDGVAPAEPRTEAQITADLERQRVRLVVTVDQLYTHVQSAALTQEVKEEASAYFASFKESTLPTLQGTAGGNAETLKKIGVVTLSVVDAIGVTVLPAVRSSRCSRRVARRVTREAAVHMPQVLKSDVTETP